MLQYTLNRLFWLIPTIIVMSLIVFLVSHFTPGSPLDPAAQGRNSLSNEQMANLRAHYGLDKPLWVQYRTFIWNALHLDFGTSFIYKTRTVNEILAGTFPISLQLGALALVIAIVLGTLLGVLAAMNQNGLVDYFSIGVAILGTSIPNFVIAIFLILIFALKLRWLPTIGWDLHKPGTLVLPTIVLALGPLAILARYTRSSMIDVIRSDYVRTARAKGLAERGVIVGHVLKNALIPVITLIGPLFAAVGTGSFVVEAVFAIPGMGKFFVTSMSGRDYPMIMAVILLYGVFLSLMNLLVDLLYGVLDPRIRLA